ncbi:MAG TPA: glycosyltransferase family 9 protein, partial [Tepidisphaeraceae bacterium]|nr:glycosyltransferase family 9 protein [Tepidisphaeraceae bacterium]
GPGHLAGVIGVPTVSLFGATEARVWKAMGPRVKVVEGMEGIQVEDVFIAVMTNVEARMTKQCRMSNDE